MLIMEGAKPFFKAAHVAFVDVCAPGRGDKMPLEWVVCAVPLVDLNLAVEAGHFIGVPIAVIET